MVGSNDLLWQMTDFGMSIQRMAEAVGSHLPGTSDRQVATSGARVLYATP